MRFGVRSRRGEMAYPLGRLVGLIFLTHLSILLFGSMFQRSVGESIVHKDRQDIDTLKQQIVLHDSQEPSLTGTSFDPLRGRYLQEIPKNSWGSDYLLDADVGVIVSWGADGKPGGADEDADLVVRYKAPPQIQKAELVGPWGRPAAGTCLRLTWTKPFKMGDTRLLLGKIALIRDTTVMNDFVTFRCPYPIMGCQAHADAPFRWGCIWRVNRGEGVPGRSDLRTDPDAGVLVVYVDPMHSITPSDKDIELRPGMALNVAVVPWRGFPEPGGESPLTDLDRAGIGELRERYAKGGPLDPGVWGPGVPSVGGAVAILPVGTENRGTPIEPISVAAAPRALATDAAHPAGSVKSAAAANRAIPAAPAAATGTAESAPTVPAAATPFAAAASAGSRQSAAGMSARLLGCGCH